MNDYSRLYQDKADKKKEYQEEIATEFSFPYSIRERQARSEQRRKDALSKARSVGYISLLFAVISLFFAHFFIGAAGILLGFYTLRKGEITLGSWAIGIGGLSLIIGFLMRTSLL